ncbi:hypothetical protein HID58_011148 [Brassica napus]|uniref:Protein kinase domain-containing protein n=1 Tax=Brassica napus TaxID=3708 RepID=A0ABQ8DXG5_BRANA|nr:hypothetical protein HID58_011148 [Brassica napus]
MPFNCFRVLDKCKRNDRLGQKEAEEICTDNVRVFSYNSLRSATDDFHPSTRIGGGGFGVVYKGVLRDGTQVAVKSLSAESKQGTREFLTEINLISNIHHPNLVNLIGCCIEGNNRILVYEYLENNSLASVLLGSRSKYVPLDWSKRAAICVGTASGLAFLHEEVEPQVVHRDIKASNILLDRNFCPKIGDFGLAKLFPDNVTHISTRVAGTVWKLREEGRLLECVDPYLTKFPEAEVIRFIKVALFCTQAAAQKRPNMKQVVEMLSRKEIKLNEAALTEPGVYRGVNKGGNHRGLGLRGSSSQESSSTQDYKGKSPAVNQGSSSASVISFQSISEVAPR